MTLRHFPSLLLFILTLVATAAADVTVTTPAQAFSEMKKSFQVEKSKGLHLRYQFHLSNPQGGAWWVAVDDGTCTMGRGEIKNPSVTFTCTGDDWVQLCNGTLGGFHAYITGRLHVTGDQSAARKMDTLFP